MTSQQPGNTGLHQDFIGIAIVIRSLLAQLQGFPQLQVVLVPLEPLNGPPQSIYFFLFSSSLLWSTAKLEHSGHPLTPGLLLQGHSWCRTDLTRSQLGVTSCRLVSLASAPDTPGNRFTQPHVGGHFSRCFPRYTTRCSGSGVTWRCREASQNVQNISQIHYTRVSTA